MTLKNLSAVSAFIFIIFPVSSCSNSTQQPELKTDYSVYYKVSGTATSGTYEFTAPEGGASGSFSPSAKMITVIRNYPSGTYLSLSATATSATGDIIVIIYRDGDAWRTNTSTTSGVGASAFTDGTL